MFRRTTLLALLPLAVLTAHAQTVPPADTGRPVTLAPVILQAERAEAFQAGLHTRTPDSLTRQQYQGLGLADLLSEQAGITVRSYGAGGIALPSFRGTSAYHTGIVWNGIVLNPPTLGQADLSLYPANSLGGSVRIQPGGASALYGSGLVGGAVHLQTDRPTGGWQSALNLTGGSFGLGAVQAEVAGSMPSGIWSRSLVAIQSANNDFDFTNIRQLGRPRQRQTQARVQQGNLQQDLGWTSADARWDLRSHLWVSGTRRQIPATLTDTRPGREILEDANTRALVQLQHLRGATSYRLRAAWLNDFLRYNSDPGNATNSDTRVNQWIQEAEVRRQVSAQWVLLAGLHHSSANARTRGYGETPRAQDRYAAFASASHTNRAGWLQTDLTLRQEWTPDWGRAPFTPAWGANARLTTGPWQLFAQGNLSRVYRLPTLNERFWRPGGVANLAPEEGWSGELGPRLTGQFGSHRLEARATAFRSVIQGWVLWLPGPAGGVSPRNQPLVRAQGWETDGTMFFNWGSWQLGPGWAYTYTQSTIMDSPQRNEIGRQLLFIPYHQGSARLRLQFRDHWLQYTHAYTGARYDDNLNTVVLPAYQLAMLAAGTQHTWGRHRLGLLLQVRNLFDTSYNPLSNYPAAGRSYQLTLHYHLLPNS